jgi:hypothetical protein
VTRKKKCKLKVDEMIALRANGKTWDAIAELAGVTVAYVHRLYSREMAWRAAEAGLGEGPVPDAASVSVVMHRLPARFRTLLEEGKLPNVKTVGDFRAMSDMDLLQLDNVGATSIFALRKLLGSKKPANRNIETIRGHLNRLAKGAA